MRKAFIGPLLGVTAMLIIIALTAREETLLALKAARPQGFLAGAFMVLILYLVAGLRNCVLARMVGRRLSLWDGVRIHIVGSVIRVFSMGVPAAGMAEIALWVGIGKLSVGEASGIVVLRATVASLVLAVFAVVSALFPEFVGFPKAMRIAVLVSFIPFCGLLLLLWMSVSSNRLLVRLAARAFWAVRKRSKKRKNVSSWFVKVKGWIAGYRRAFVGIGERIRTPWFWGFVGFVALYWVADSAVDFLLVASFTGGEAIRFLRVVVARGATYFVESSIPVMGASGLAEVMCAGMYGALVPEHLVGVLVAASRLLKVYMLLPIGLWLTPEAVRSIVERAQAGQI